MKVTRASASYSRTIQPAPYESKVAKAEIDYSFAEDEAITGEQALQVAMDAAVNQVHITLGLKKLEVVAGIDRPLTATDVLEAAKPSRSAMDTQRIDADVVLDPKPVEPTEKPKRGRPAGTKNSNPAPADTLGSVSGTAAQGEPAQQNTAAPVTAPVGAQPVVAGPTATPPEKSEHTAGDLTKAAAALSARLKAAGDPRPAKDVVGTIFDKLLPGLAPPRYLTSVPDEMRSKFIAELEAVKP